MAIDQKTSAASFNAVSCAGDELDLRPALDAIEAEIRRRQPTSEKPLVVLMGEIHNNPTHVLLQQALMERLLTGASPLALAYGMEMPCNGLEAYVAQFHKVPDDVMERVIAADTDGRRMIRSASENYLYTEAAKSHKNLIRFCGERNISLSLNDVARKTRFFSITADQDYPEVCDLIRDQAPEMAGKKIGLTNPDGMKLRNLMMVRRAMEHRQRTGAAVYIQHCGRNHVLGAQYSGLEPELYEDSLCACFAAAGMDVLPVFITTRKSETRTLPADGAQVLRAQGIMIDKLDDGDYFWFGMGEGKKIREISKHSGGEVTVYPGLSMLERYRDNRDLSVEMASWIAEAKAHAPG